MYWLSLAGTTITTDLIWNVIQFILTVIGLFEVFKWIYCRTPLGKQNEFNREATLLAYENRKLFNSDIAHSVPAFLRVGQCHQQGMLLAQWWLYAFGDPPSFRHSRDPMEINTIVNTARTAIKQTLEGAKRPEYKEIYEQLYPRFNKLCEDLEALGRKHKSQCPIQFTSQERLPAP